MIAFVAAVLAVLYWLLDAYYLLRERRFRALYDKVRTTPDDVEPFSMATPCSPEKGRSLWATLWSPTELLSHIPLVAMAVAVAIVM